jgi:HD-GYP domain-containing protein (c-di-GMP phosphodiesterase class II)
VLHHHERWDGRGYPAGLSGESIPASARILAVADAFDAQTSERLHRSGMSVGKAADEIRARKGMQFDPDVADALLAVIQGRAVGGLRSTRRVAV